MDFRIEIIVKKKVMYCLISSRGGAVANSDQAGSLKVTLQFSSTLAAHAHRGLPPAGTVQGSPAGKNWMSGQKSLGYITAA